MIAIRVVVKTLSTRVIAIRVVVKTLSMIGVSCGVCLPLVCVRSSDNCGGMYRGTPMCCVWLCASLFT